jgi:hypothetical protein
MGLRVQEGQRLGAARVRLPVEIVEHTDLVAALNQRIDESR